MNVISAHWLLTIGFAHLWTLALSRYIAGINHTRYWCVWQGFLFTFMIYGIRRSGASYEHMNNRIENRND